MNDSQKPTKDKTDRIGATPSVASEGQSPLSASAKSAKVVSATSEIDAFLESVKETTPVASPDGRGRLIFSLDATASRQATWDRAMSLQGDMFVKTRGLGALDVQLVYYRGYRECRASKWINRADRLLSMMQKVSCEAGRTQIERVLKHALAESKTTPVQALVFVGDCVEENIDVLGDLAGQLRIIGLPVFIFQEGYNLEATMAFKSIAKLSGGAHCRFDESSAEELGRLLNAVAVYAAGGKAALKQLSADSPQARVLLEQLGPG